MTKTPTAAGAKLLKKFLERQRAGFLDRLVDGEGIAAGCGMALPAGDGGALAAAQRLERDGLALLVGRRHRRFIIATDAGIKAVLNN
jgi:hypothetical protein